MECYLGVVYEGTAFRAIRGELTGRGILEALNDGLRAVSVIVYKVKCLPYSLARAIISDDQG